MISSIPWPRAILLVDMNAFFASIEQQNFPELRGRPVAVTNRLRGTCVITSSYEARGFGPTDDGRVIRALSDRMLEEAWAGEGVDQVQVTALDPLPNTLQLDLVMSHDLRREACNAAMDPINERYGEFTVHTARLKNRSDMPNVIAPAWKPFGHRQTIP